VERLVLSLTNADDSVFDPYVGVGSSVIAAVKRGRIGIGCDLEPKYIELARERLADLRAGLLKLRPMEKPVYDPSLPNGGHK
jgi:adenine-specific DNA-methyltransferase